MKENDFIHADIRPIPSMPNALLIRYADGTIQFMSISRFISEMVDLISSNS